MSEKKTENQDFQQKALGNTPTIALSICGIIIALSLSFRIADIEVSEGINKFIAAKARAVELEVEGQANVPSDLEKRLELIEERLNTIKDTQDELKRFAHETKGKLIYVD